MRETQRLGKSTRTGRGGVTPWLVESVDECPTFHDESQPCRQLAFIEGTRDKGLKV